MKQKYCLPIIKPKTTQILEIIFQNKSYDFFEIWLDYIEDLNLDFIINLMESYGEKLIFLFRRQNLETPKMNFKKRIEIIELLRGSDCSVDLDFFSQQNEVEYLGKNAPGINLILSYHNYKETPSDQELEKIIELMTKKRAKVYKIATFCRENSDAIRLIDLNISLKEKGINCIVLGMGKKGSVTRIAGAVLENPFIFAPVSNKEQSASGQFTNNELEKILKNLKVCFFLADPVLHSLSPQMHTAGYIALGQENNFLYLRKKVKSDDLKKTVNQLKKDSNFKGASISSPHKIEIMKHLDKIDETAKKIGAVNTIVKDKDLLIGYNTDYLGILSPIKKKISNLRGKSAAVIGAGGAARAAVYALTSEGCNVVIFNRDIRKAQKLALDFNCNFESLKNIHSLSNFDIIVNATKVGMDPQDKSIIPQKLIKQNQVIFDVVYLKDSKETDLIKEAKKQEAKTISGMEMLLFQGVAQFELFTNRKAPIEAMRKALI